MTDQDLSTSDQKDNVESQLDIATSFLAIVLLYFVVLLILATQIGDGDTDYRHFRKTEQSTTVAHRQFRYLNPFRRLWIVEGGKIAELDMSVPALLTATADNPPLQKVLSDGTKLVVDWGKEYGHSGFRLSISRPDTTDPRFDREGLWTRVQTFDEFTTEDPEPSDIVFVRPDTALATLIFLERLTESGLGPRVRFLEKEDGNWHAQIVRRPQSFQIEGGFR